MNIKEVERKGNEVAKNRKKLLKKKEKKIEKCLFKILEIFDCSSIDNIVYQVVLRLKDSKVECFVAFSKKSNAIFFDYNELSSQSDYNLLAEAIQKVNNLNITEKLFMSIGLYLNTNKDLLPDFEVKTSKNSITVSITCKTSKTE